MESRGGKPGVADRRWLTEIEQKGRGKELVDRLILDRWKEQPPLLSSKKVEDGRLLVMEGGGLVVWWERRKGK
ncbi:unnamed protein product [Linum trigynum]|uniref:Uncharacterized protein n=1 Tax=Linum trigynum TaxID=586398 RepID=A0AAV2DLB8_9ROSI